ncbi:MAG TPA: ORF6N domain-containing protein [Steroidobacteraceae bacterium]|nr:ORF6N domain-containing protein [Steroidobacteraceae bacterium]
MSKSVASYVDLEDRIFTIRGLPVLLDMDLALLYGVSTKALLQAVRRNPDRFPSDFMFPLSNQELALLRSQIVTSSSASGHGGRRVLPYAFTEQGVAMLSSVLRSETAVRVNIEVMRAFVRLRRAAVISGEILKLIEDLASRVDANDQAIEQLVEAIRALTSTPPVAASRPIGFTADIK